MTMRAGPMRSLAIVACLLSGVCTGGDAAARAGDGSFAGRTVRIWAPSVTQKRLTGKLVALRGDRMILALQDRPMDTMEIDLASVRTVELAEGKRSNMLLGAVGGMAAGGAVGAVVGTLWKRDDGSGGERFNGVALGAGVGVGFVVGTLLGIHSESEVWKRIPPERLRLGLRPGPGGAPQVALRLRF